MKHSKDLQFRAGQTVKGHYLGFHFSGTVVEKKDSDSCAGELVLLSIKLDAPLLVMGKRLDRLEIWSNSQVACVYPV